MTTGGRWLVWCGGILIPTLAAIGPAISAEAAPETALQEVVVTAQRQAEKLENVPATVNVLSAASVEQSGGTNSLDLTRLVPALRMERTGTFVQPVIRGIGSFTNGPGQDANVAIYVDGYYQPFQQGNVFDLSNISQIEVLKGPQGTLFGRNATGGAILVTTAPPSTTTQGSAEATIAQYADYRFRGYITGPLADELSASLAVNARKADGWVKNIFTGRDPEMPYESYGARGKLKFQPNTTSSYTLTLAHTEVSDLSGTSLDVLGNQSVGRRVPGAIIASNRGEVSNNFQLVNLVSKDDVQLTSEWSIGPGKLTSYTGFTRAKEKGQSDNDGSSAQISAVKFGYSERTYTQEFVASLPLDRLDLVGGANIYRDLGRNVYLISYTATAAVPGNTWRQHTDAYGIFLNGTYRIGESLFLTAGGRFSQEKKQVFYSAGLTADHTWRAFTPRASMRYEIAPGSNVYLTYSQGFKSGAYNAGARAVVPVNPEKSTATEIGYKTVGDRYRLNISAYYTKYKDLQITAFTYPNGLAVTTLINAASSIIKGGEADFSFKPTPELELSAAGAYTIGKFDYFPTAVGYILNPDGSNTSAQVSATGKNIPRSPKFSGTLRAVYTKPLATGSTLVLSGDLYATSQVYFDAPNQLSGKGYTTLNLRAAWKSDRGWEVAVFGTNVLDKTYYEYEALSVNYAAARYGAPRVIGASVQKTF